MDDRVLKECNEEFQKDLRDRLGIIHPIRFYDELDSWREHGYFTVLIAETEDIYFRDEIKWWVGFPITFDFLEKVVKKKHLYRFYDFYNDAINHTLTTSRILKEIYIENFSFSKDSSFLEDTKSDVIYRSVCTLTKTPVIQAIEISNFEDFSCLLRRGLVKRRHCGK